jgi:hypothetical protein
MRRRGNNWAGAAALLVFGIVLALAGAEMGARLLMPHWREFDSERFIGVPEVGAGVTLAAGGFDDWFAQNNGDFRVRITIDSRRLRNPPDANPAGALWAVGDSFTFGWGVERDQTFGRVAAQALGLGDYNVASPGTDVRGYRRLAARMPKDARPRAVLVGLTMENDIHLYEAEGAAAAPAETPSAPPPSALRQFWVEAKNQLTAHSAFYNFLSSTLKRSPAVVGALTRLGLVELPLDPLWAHDSHTPEEINTTADEIAALSAMLPAGTPLAVVVIPTRFELQQPGGGWSRDREAMMAALRERKLAVVDPEPELRAAGLAAAHHAHDGHWSVLGHRIAGDKAAAVLAERFPDLKEAR